MIDLSSVKTLSEVPEGDHPARILDAEVLVARSGGRYLKIKCVLEDCNEEIFENFSLEVQPDKKPVGLIRLKTLASVCGITNPDKFDLIELGGKRFTAHVKMKQDENYGAQLKITNFKPLKTEADLGDIKL